MSEDTTDIPEYLLFANLFSIVSVTIDVYISSKFLIVGTGFSLSAIASLDLSIRYEDTLVSNALLGSGILEELTVSTGI